MSVLPDVFAEPPGADLLTRILEPLQTVLDDLADEVELAIPELFDLATTPPALIRRLHPVDQVDEVTYACLAFLAGWVGLTLRPPPARSLQWNRQYLLRALHLLPMRGTLPGIDGLLRAWLADDIVDPVPHDEGGPILIATDLSPHTNGAGSSFQLNETASLGVDTVLGPGPDSFVVIDLVLRSQVALLRCPVGVDALRRAALSLLDAERPAHVHGELRLRGHTMQLAPPGAPDTWGDAAPPYARLADPDSSVPNGTAMVWADPWVARFPDKTLKGSEW